MLPTDSISNFMCGVNEISTKNCTKSINFDDLDINDVLENIRILLNYIKKQRELQLRVRRGGWTSTHEFGAPLSPPKNLHLHFFKKSSACIRILQQKVSGTAHPLYAALRAARQNPDSSSGQFKSIQVWAHLYELARTYFSRNPD